MNRKQFILATAGHVDHGKSALIKALTGTDPDRLPEEKARGITIDLGFAHLELPEPGRPETIFEVGIIDVPGHEDFVKNMVAGVGSVDLALLVVAADDGWMPQTEEHLQILSYLGLGKAVIALTKSDLPSVSLELVLAQLQEQLARSPFAAAPVVPTSVVSGAGLPDLKTALAAVLSQTTPAPDVGKPRLPVDRVFSRHGIGTVVTGTLNGGCLEQGQTVVIQPLGRPARVRGLQTYHQSVPRSGPGTRTAVNLTDLGAAGRGLSAGPERGVQRGDVLTVAGLGSATSWLHVWLTKSDRLRETEARSARPLQDGLRVRVHHGSASLPARIRLMEAKEIAAGESGLAELRLEGSLFALAGDRLVIRDWSGQTTLGGGMILDPDARPRRFQDTAQRQFLARRARSALAARIFAETELERGGAVRCSDLLGRSVFGAAEARRALAELQEEGRARLLGDWALDAPWWDGIRGQAREAIEQEHRSHPERPGLALNDLRARLSKRLPAPELFDALVQDLLRQGYVQAGHAVRRISHQPALPPHLQETGAAIRAALQAKPFEPPSRKELLRSPNAALALRFLRETGETIELGEDVVLLAEQYLRMKEMIVARIRSQGPATVSDLRVQLGTTRRIMMPLLERLDRDGVTLRQGDRRSLGRNG